MHNRKKGKGKGKKNIKYVVKYSMKFVKQRTSMKCDELIKMYLNKLRDEN